MGIAGFSTVSMLSSIAAPFVGPSLALARRLGRSASTSRVQTGAVQANHATWAATGRVAAVPGQQQMALRRSYSFLTRDERLGDASSGTQTPINRLKVLRVVEASARRDCAGRMVISGRMADVCAELDRMASRESV